MKKPIKKFTFHPKIFALSISIAALVAYGLSSWTKLNFWICFVIVIFSMFINGLIADAEDNLPGGLNNPTEAQRTGKKSSKKATAKGYPLVAGPILVVALAGLIFFGRQGLGGGVVGFGILMVGVFMALAVLVAGWINTRNEQRSDEVD